MGSSLYLRHDDNLVLGCKVLCSKSGRVRLTLKFGWMTVISSRERSAEHVHGPFNEAIDSQAAPAAVAVNGWRK